MLTPFFMRSVQVAIDGDGAIRFPGDGRGNELIVVLIFRYSGNSGRSLHTA
jgi:hypothetical protein